MEKLEAEIADGEVKSKDGANPREQQNDSESEGKAKDGASPQEPPKDAEPVGNVCKKSHIRTAAIATLVLAGVLALAFMAASRRGGEDAGSTDTGSFELPVDEIAAEMIAGFDGFSFAVTNGERIVHVGKFVAKRASAVGGRVRINFDATAYEPGMESQWKTSVLIEFSLVGEGSRLRGDKIVVRRIHVYDLPKSLGSDELEYNPRVVSILESRIRSSKEVVSDSQKVVGVKLTTDDKIIISWENAK